MAKSTPTIFLFHGNDSLASGRALRGWEKLFSEKHDGIAKYRIEVDELDEQRFVRELEIGLGSQGLFTTKRFCVIKRPTAQEKGNARGYSTKLVAQLDKFVAAADLDCTVVVWEDKALPDTHVLTKWFAEREVNGIAKRMLYSVSHPRELVSAIQSQLQSSNLSLSKSAAQYIYQLLVQREKEQRLLAQLRSQETLARDVRSWWLQQLCELLVLLVPSPGIVEVEDVQKVSESLEVKYGIFEVANAIIAGNTALALNLLHSWEDQRAEDSQYFALLSVLRKQARGDKVLLKLLADAELFSKNSVLPLPLLFHVLVRRYAKQDPELLPGKLVWLSKLPAA